MEDDPQIMDSTQCCVFEKKNPRDQHHEIVSRNQPVQTTWVQVSDAARPNASLELIFGQPQLR